MAYLINGNGYTPVTAQQDADLYAGIVGQRLQVLNVGQKMAASLIDSNTVRIGDGEALCQGRRIHNDPGMYDDFIIPNGSQGTTHWYIIGYKLHTDSGTGQEIASAFVQQMSSATATITEDVLRDGASECYVSFYRVTQTNVSLTNVQPLYDKTYSIEEMLELMYPVGSIFMTVNNTNPGIWMQHTTWIAWGTGRVPVGVNTSDSNFNSVEKTGGASTVTLTVNQIPGHQHTLEGQAYQWFDAPANTQNKTEAFRATPGQANTNKTGSTGGGQSHNNLQPYITCYMFKRTA